MLQIEELGLTGIGLALAVVAVWAMRRRSVSRLAQRSMIAGVFGLFLCAKFARSAGTMGDQLMLLGVAGLMIALVAQGMSLFRE